MYTHKLHPLYFLSILYNWLLKFLKRLDYGLKKFTIQTRSR